MSKRIPSGEHPVSLDGKGRVVIPVPFREYLRDGLVLTRGFEGGVDVLTLPYWQKVAERLESMPTLDLQSRHFRKIYYASAHSTKLDKQGRVLVPPALRRTAGLRDRVVVLSTGDHVEIWDEDRYFERLEELSKQFGIPEPLRDL